MKKLVLLDGHAIIHRAYHALPELTTREGQPVNAVYGFANMLLKVIDTLNPTHMVVAFDLPIATFRHEAYIGYQSHRPTTDDGLKSQISLVRELVEAAGIKTLSCPGFEADDIIGTLAVQAETDEVIIVTGDRDILQLVRDKVRVRDGREKSVKVYMLTSGLSQAKVFGEQEVEEYLGVKPSEMVEYKALVGDPSDNYPGVLGIGPKTAIDLIRNFGTVENLYKSLEQRTPEAKKLGEKVVQKLKEGYESAMLSHKLATIITDAPIEINLEDAKIEDVAHRKEFLDKLHEFGFKSLHKRLTGEERETENTRPEKKRSNGQIGLL
ncbi:MAG: hypothetical protein HYU80_04210 [Candidatus Blackburnbacteria bacterium]|nr:hypothetical protein [Candidatus Blackburnbacteria bacterium]